MSEHQGWDLNVVVVVYTIHYKTIFNILIEWPLQWNDHCIDVNTNLADFTGVVVSSFCCFSNTTNVWDCAPVQRRYNYPRRWHDIKILIACPCSSNVLQLVLYMFNQCDKMAWLFFIFWPFKTMIICPIACKICQSRFRILPNLQNIAMDLQDFAKVAKFR